MNESLDLPKQPPEFEEILKDPRLEGMQDAPKWLPREFRILQPENPPVAGESRYLLFREYNEERFGNVKWLNKPSSGMDLLFRMGEGRGFGPLTEQPRFKESKKKPAQRVDAWSNLSWLIVSPGFANVLRQFDPEVIETVPIDWEFTDGRKLDGYQFLDIKRRIDAYDYRRSAVRVEIKDGRKFVAGLAHPRALKPGIDPKFHVFRDAYFRKDIFMSRELASALIKANMQGIRFEDPVSIHTVRF